MKGIIYTRVSSDEQVKGTSLEFQEDLCRKYAKQREIEIVELFREEGESAKDLSLNNRKRFLEALEFCRKHKNQIEAFIVLRVDRFARNTEDHFAVRKILLGYGTTLHSVTEPIGNKPAEKFIETVLAGAAEYDNAIRKQRCTDGMLAKINHGLYPFKPPLGYKCLQFKKRGEKKTIPDPPDETVFPIIQKGLKEFARGVYTQKQLLNMLITSGLKTASGKKPNLDVVGKILRKNLKFYAGIIVNPWTGEEIDGLHKPMITEDELYRIERVLLNKSERINLTHKRLNPLFPLKNIVLCERCNHQFTGSSPRGNGGRYNYYHCKNKICPMYGKGVTKEKLESDFSRYLGEIVLKEKLIPVFKKTLLDVWRVKNKAKGNEVKRHKLELSVLETKRKRIFEMREEGSYTKEEFIERKKALESELALTKQALNSIQNNDLDISGILKFAIDFMFSLPQKWKIMPLELNMEFQKLIFPKGITYQINRGFGTTNMSYIFKLFQAFKGSNSLKVDLNRVSWNQVVLELYTWRKLIRKYEESIKLQDNDVQN